MGAAFQLVIAIKCPKFRTTEANFFFALKEIELLSGEKIFVRLLKFKPGSGECMSDKIRNKKYDESTR